MSDKTPSCIEDLANEIWLEVFDYVDWVNLFTTFYGINKRINELLVSIRVLSLYSSFLINHANTTCIFFKEFLIEEFKRLQHFQLIYDNPYEDAWNIVKDLSSLSTFISLNVNANNAGVESDCGLWMNFFRQNCPFLRRLYLYGNVFDQELRIMNDVCMFHFPSLLHIHVNKLQFILAIQLLDQCTQLRSFSAILYDYPKEDEITTSSFLLPNRIRMGLPAIKKLSLGEDNYQEKESISAFLELLLPCFPNLRTFNVHIRCNDNCEKITNPTWWTHVFASNNQLIRIFLRLNWWTRNIAHNAPQKIQRFQSSPFFTQLNVDIRYDFDSEFMRSMSYDLFIKN